MTAGPQTSSRDSAQDRRRAREDRGLAGASGQARTDRLPPAPRERRPTLAALAVLLIVGGATAACSSVPDDPVPTTATEPFVCDGVPLEGARLMTGEGDIQRSSSSGTWADPQDAVVCNLESTDGTGVLTVSQEPLAWHGTGDAEEYIETVAGLDGAQEVEAAADGVGYAYPEGEETVSAQWACGDHRLTVNVYRLAGGDRDPLIDASRYMTSMLRWACEGVDAPGRTTG